MKLVKQSLVAMLLASAALAFAAPAIAKEAPAAAPAGPKPSKLFLKPLFEIQKLQQAGDNAGALAKLKEVEALPDPTPDDTFIITQMKYNAAIGLKDNVMLEEALIKLLASGRIPPADQPKFLSNIAALSSNRKDYVTATGALEKLSAMAPNDSNTLVSLSELYFVQKQNAKAAETLGKAIAVNKAAGQAVPEGWYRRQLALAYESKMTNALMPAALALVQAFPNPVNWRDAVIITRESYPSLTDQENLDFMRLQEATNSLNGERDYIEYANTAIDRGLPGEAKKILDIGLANNMLSPTKPIVAELTKTAAAKVTTDKASLPALEKESKTNAKLALGTADALYGYGEYARAAALYQVTVGDPKVDQNIANLRLGAALAKAGDKAGAAKALKAVKGGPREMIAQYWLAMIGG